MPNQHIYNVAMTTPSTVNAATQTILQIATPATRRAWIKEFAVSGKDTDGAKVPIRVDLMRQDDAGTGGTVLTPRGLSPGFPAALFTARELLATEPANTGAPIARGPWYVTSVGGLFVLQIPLGDEIELLPNNFVGLRIITEGAITGVLANMVVAE